MSDAEDDAHGRFVTREELSAIALVAAKEAVRQTMNETFGMFGVNLANFESIQEFRDTIEWARTGRNISRLTGNRLWTGFVAIIGGGVILGFWEGLKLLITKHT
jgi:hypothetical protein